METNESINVVELGKMSIDEKKEVEIKDEDKEVSMTHEQLLDYMMMLLDKYKTNPEINILESMKNELDEQENKIREKTEEAEKMQRFFSLLMRDQEKYFRHVGVLPELQMKDLGVHVDLPPDNLPINLPSANIQEMSKDRIVPSAAIVTRALTITPVVPPAPKAAAGSSEGLKKATEVQKPKPPSSNKASVEVIDLTDDESSTSSKTPQANNKGANVKSIASSPTSMTLPSYVKHPAPLPYRPHLPVSTNLKHLPPKPSLRISAEKQGIVLQWNLALLPAHAAVKSYEIYGYQESKTGPVNSALWKKIGDVKALVLPMACTLTQFVEGFRYHFAIRALDEHLRPGQYSDPASIIFLPAKAKP